MGGPPIGPAHTGAGRGCEALLDGREGSEALLESWDGSRGPGKVGSFSQTVGRSWEALPEGWEGSGGLPAGPGNVRLLEIPWTRINLTDAHAAARKVA